MEEARRLYLDTNALIAIVEKEGELSAAQAELVEEIDAGKVRATTSELALAECLVKPLAERDETLVRSYLTLLGGEGDLVTMIPVTRDVILEAAKVRAGSRVKLPDAIHLASARMSGCAEFVSNDRRLKGATPTFRLWSELGQS